MRLCECTGRAGSATTVVVRTRSAIGLQATFESALRSIRPGGTVSSLGVYSSHLSMPLEAISAGLADQRVLTMLCPRQGAHAAAQGLRPRACRAVHELLSRKA